MWRQNNFTDIPEGMYHLNKIFEGFLQGLKEKYNVNYIMTHRLNQDVIETLFIQVKNSNSR